LRQDPQLTALAEGKAQLALWLQPFAASSNHEGPSLPQPRHHSRLYHPPPRGTSKPRTGSHRNASVPRRPELIGGSAIHARLSARFQVIVGRIVHHVEHSGTRTMATYITAHRGINVPSAARS